MYYMIGFNYFEGQRANERVEFIKKISEEIVQLTTYFSYEIADLKTLLFDLDGSVRGIGGCKQTFKVDELPSVKRANIEKNRLLTESRKDETPEEKLARHKEFFKNLKSSFK